MRNIFLSKLFSLFQISLDGLRKNKIEFMIQAHQQTTTIDLWPYYEFEDYISILNKRNEEEKKSREKNEKSQSNSSEYNNMMKAAKSMNSFKPPNMGMPRL